MIVIKDKWRWWCAQCGHVLETTTDLRPNHCGMSMKAKNGEDMRNYLRHPIQPAADDGNDVLRFKENAIVKFLLDEGPLDMNALARMPFSAEDREQFAQLIGYSVVGFYDLSYVRAETTERVESATSDR